MEIDYLNQDFDCEYVIDMVMCIDGTQSMRPMIDKVKQNALNFYNLYKKEMKNQDKPVKDDGLRIKVIVFRDFSTTRAEPMVVSDWFIVSREDQKIAFEQFVNGIVAEGGGKNPAENALEAIAVALNADWTVTGGNYRRQVIMVFTDNNARDIRNGDCVASQKYPNGMPKDFEELIRIWEFGDQEFAPKYVPNLGRLIVFAPMENSEDKDLYFNGYRQRSWCNDLVGINRYYPINVDKNGGCKQIELADVMTALVGSIR